MLTPTENIQVIKQLSNKYYLECRLSSTKLQIILNDLIKQVVYLLQCTQNNMKNIVPGFITLEDIFQTLKPSQQFQNKNIMSMNKKVQVNRQKQQLYKNYFQYNFGQVIRYKNVDSYKIQQGGKLTIFITLVNGKTNKQKIYQILLNLSYIRQMSEMEIMAHTWNCQKCELKQQIMQSKEQSKRYINKLQQRISDLQKKYRIVQQKLNNIQTTITNKQKIKQLNSINKKGQKQKDMISGQHIKKQYKKLELTPAYKLKQILPLAQSFDIEVYPSSSGNITKINNQQYKCSVGRNGATIFKKQGDGKTPVGTFQLRQIWIRTDKITIDIYDILLKIGLPVYIINEYDGWCDEPTSPYYNKHVDLRQFDVSVSHQNLWRNDNLYDCFIVVGYNDRPVIPNKGSAIFIHVARQNYSGTAGCIAFSKPDLWQLMKKLKSYSRITINEEKNII